MSTATPLTKLVEVAELNPPLAELLSEGEQVAFMPMSAVEADSVSAVDRETRLYSEVRKGYTPFLDGDVLVAKITPCFENGKIALAHLTRRHGFGSTEFHVVRPRSGRSDARYLVYFLRQDYIRRQGESRMTGSAGQRRVPEHFLAGLNVPVPPLPEQRRIAEILDKADALRAKRRSALARLDSLTQSIFLDMFGDPATNPKRWPKTTLGQIIEFVGGSQPPRETFTYEPSPETIRLVQIRDFRSDEFKTYIPRKLARRFFEEDDVMIGRYGPPVFQILRGLSGSYNVALMKALPRADVLKDFIFHLLQEQRLHSFVVARSERTAGQTGVNLELLERYSAYLPPIDTQREFARQISVVEKVKTAQRTSLKVLDALFTNLQHHAFCAEL